MVVRSDPKFGARLGRPELSPEQLIHLYSRSSLSGHERNHFFLSQSGEQFVDLSALSGLDHPGDSRAFALLDFDRDGWLDVAVVNANAPLLQLFRNRLGDRPETSAQMIGLRFVGGNHAATPDSKRSNRDGYGASVTVDLGDLRIVREHRAGEGFAAQNRPRMLIGLGAHREVRSLSVRWPSGQVRETGLVAAGSLVTVYEEPTDSPTGEAFTVEPHIEPAAAGSSRNKPTEWLRLTGEVADAPGARLRMFTTVATWCEACRHEMPQLQLLRATFDAQDLEMFGVPIDESESRRKLEAYVARHAPAYRLLLDLRPQQIAEVKTKVLETLHHEAIPATLITDSEGDLLYVEGGVPTVSDLRRLLDSP